MDISENENENDKGKEKEEEREIQHQSTIRRKARKGEMQTR